MNIRQIGNFNGDLVTSILHNRGIFDIEKYINPTCEDDTNIYSIPNITDVCQIIKKHIGKFNMRIFTINRLFTIKFF